MQLLAPVLAATFYPVFRPSRSIKMYLKFLETGVYKNMVLFTLMLYFFIIKFLSYLNAFGNQLQSFNSKYIHMKEIIPHGTTYKPWRTSKLISSNHIKLFHIKTREKLSM